MNMNLLYFPYDFQIQLKFFKIFGKLYRGKTVRHSQN